MAFSGVNFNTIYGNKSIPEGYIFNPSTSSTDAVAAAQALMRHSKPAMVRSLIWATERDPVSTPWLHIPLTDEEIQRIIYMVSTVLNENSNTHYELSFGALWEALPDSVAGQLPGDVKPDNPFATMDELAVAVLDTFRRLCVALSSLPTARILIDAWNELDTRTQPKNMQLINSIYPKLVEIFLNNKISYTFSTIIEPDGNMKRAKATYAALEEIQKRNRLPRLATCSLHMNGFTDAMLKKHGAKVIQNMRTYTGCPVGIGECDCPTSFETELSIMYARPVYFCQW